MTTTDFIPVSLYLKGVALLNKLLFWSFINDAKYIPVLNSFKRCRMEP